MRDASVSARGVYYDLKKSPYKFVYEGLELKFSSKNKLDVFTKRFNAGKIKIDIFCETYGLDDWKIDATKNLARDVYKKMRRV